MQTTALDYRDGAVTCKGYLARDGKGGGKRPGIVVFPEAFGLGEHAIGRARRLAELGFVALAADPYGNGAQATDLPKAIEMMGAVRSEVGIWRRRATAALDALKAQPDVDPARLAAIGYCFGGSTALELARGGAALAAVVGFHSGLASLRPEDAANITAKVLVCLGADDPLIPPAQIAAFEDEMRKTKADWQVHVHGGAVHSFTNPEADALCNPALAYQAAADHRSWNAMLALFAEAFGAG